MTQIVSIDASLNSLGPVTGGGDGNGYWDGSTNGGVSVVGNPNPDPADINGAQVSCIAYQSVPDTFVVVVYGTVAQTLFSTLDFIDKNSDPESYDTSLATFDTATFPGFSMWTWPALVTYPFFGAPNPVAITIGGGPPPGVPVPNVAGSSVATATDSLVTAGFIVGTITEAYSDDIPAGFVISTVPPAFSEEAPGSTVDLIVSKGHAPVVVPDVLQQTLASAKAETVAAGLTAGVTTPVYDGITPIGSVSGQSIAAGTLVPFGTVLNYDMSVFSVPFDVSRTVISQYANSPTILAIVQNMEEYLDQTFNMVNFYTFVWNVDSAKGFGLDIWGRIVGVSRLLQISSANQTFGFDNADFPPDWQPWNQGTFSTGTEVTQSYLLPDDTYRTLILTKALSNIAATTAPALNRLLQNLFPGRGRAYVLDLGGMAMRFVFEFSLTNVEYAILTQSGALPHPAGVFYSVVVIAAAGNFGFSEMGYGAQTFDNGVFYVPAG